MPSEFFQAGYYLDRDTVRVYERLLARRRSLRVREIDEYGHPRVYCRFLRKDGRWEWHALAFNHDGIVRVNRRKPAG